MSRRRVVLIVVVLTLLTCVAAPVLLYRRESPLERAYHRLRMGMSKAEVGEVMGRPPDEKSLRTSRVRLEGRGYTVLHETEDSAAWFSSDDPVQRWQAGDYWVTVFYSNGYGDRVIETNLIGPAPSPLLQRLRDWLGF